MGPREVSLSVLKVLLYAVWASHCLSDRSREMNNETILLERSQEQADSRMLSSILLD